MCVSYPLDLLQLFIELIEGLTVLHSHLGHQLLVNFSVILQSLLQLSHFCLTLRPVVTSSSQSCDHLTTDRSR